MTRTKKGGIRWALVAGFGLLIVLLISACGTSGVAGSKSTANPSLSPQQTALKFAQCMRANGYPNFPDPDASGRINLDPNSGLDPNDPNSQKATQACKKYLTGSQAPQGTDPASQAKMVKFAQCMRTHGVPNFPDPSSSGGISVDPGSGIDPNDPTFQKAQQACASIVGASGSTTTGGTGR